MSATSEAIAEGDFIPKNAIVYKSLKLKFRSVHFPTPPTLKYQVGYGSYWTLT